MKPPNAASTVIEPAKLERYLLDVDHPVGGGKARLLVSLGYSAANWPLLARDFRTMHLAEDVLAVRQTLGASATKFTGPGGDTVLFRSIWQIDLGTEAPRLITMYPE